MEGPVLSPRQPRSPPVFWWVLSVVIQDDLRQDPPPPREKDETRQGTGVSKRWFLFSTKWESKRLAFGQWFLNATVRTQRVEGLKLHYYAGAEVENKAHADVSETYKTDRGVFYANASFPTALGSSYWSIEFPPQIQRHAKHASTFLLWRIGML